MDLLKKASSSVEGLFEKYSKKPETAMTPKELNSDLPSTSTSGSASAMKKTSKAAPTNKKKPAKRAPKKKKAPRKQWVDCGPGSVYHLKKECAKMKRQMLKSILSDLDNKKPKVSISSDKTMVPIKQPKISGNPACAISTPTSSSISPEQTENVLKNEKKTPKRQNRKKPEGWIHDPEYNVTIDPNCEYLEGLDWEKKIPKKLQFVNTGWGWMYDSSLDLSRVIDDPNSDYNIKKNYRKRKREFLKSFMDSLKDEKASASSSTKKRNTNPKSKKEKENLPNSSLEANKKQGGWVFYSKYDQYCYEKVAVLKRREKVVQ